VSPFTAPETAADVIVLAGDVARPEAGVAWARELGKPVIYVPGNHEFYGGSIPGTVARLRAAAAGSDVHVLASDALVLDGVRFLGSTLWTDFQLYGNGPARDLAVRGALDFVRDFTRIRLDDAGTAFTPDAAAALFRDNARWLDTQLDEPFDGPTVVVSHHAPSPRSIHPRFAESILNPCFVSEAEWLLDGRRAALWIHGHSHDSFDYSVNGTRVLCNPRGYTKGPSVENRSFAPDLVVEVRSL
jgi:predicted phosphodiesterase